MTVGNNVCCKLVWLRPSYFFSYSHVFQMFWCTCHSENTANHPFMVNQENKPPLYLVLCALSPFPWPWKLLCNFFFAKNPKTRKMWVALIEALQCGGVCACTENILSRQFFMSFWLCLCSDSIDGVNAVNKSEQRSCLQFVQDFSTAGILLTIIFCKSKPVRTGLPWSRTFGAKAR